ncbi:class I SAM-dependent rRNA methyltransferase [Myxococcota bacterium]|nr:class I SAM-dependent rRNA methyltransferase [Myxococcota bacterium]MBU1432918.1 class I SAM-dependent rRNA methyltransferase [Myxococcota bacterium]MBU1899301.1 class I SAM-dependent rRNA methyltransferase [Myxococcota bacterium]
MMIQLTPRGVKRLARHPWIFKSDIASVPEGVIGGDLVQVGAGRPLGVAAYSEASQITLRMMPISHKTQDLEAAFMGLLSAACDRREGREVTRLVNGDADGLPGLVVDRYGPGLSLQLLTQAAARREAEIVAALTARYTPTVIALRNDVRVREMEGLARDKRLLLGEAPTVTVRVGGVLRVFDLLEGQKTGGFLDQIENHQAAGRFAQGDCLDCFSYDGGFSLALAAAGRSVTAMDTSARALEKLTENAALNGLDVGVLEANVFEQLRVFEREGRRFQTIVLDPPPFARAKRDLAAGRRAYKEINLRALKLLKPGGRLITCTCSAHLSRDEFERVVAEAAADARRWARIIERRGAPSDHPILLSTPETDYLKVLFIEVD